MIRRNKYSTCESSASSDSYYFEFELMCDLCGKSYGVYNSFNEAVIAKKENHIRSLKNVDGTWTELCPKCAERMTKHETGQ